MKTLVIGDIHGCFVELQALLDRAGLTADDAIIALGDIVDRGPETPQVLDFFRGMVNTQSLMGNHERKHIRSFHNEIRPALSQIISCLQLKDGYQDAITFMESLPCFLELPDAILVHGALEPDIPLTQQNESILCGTMGGERILKTRYSREWYDLYNGKKPVIVGHQDYSGKGEPVVYHDLIYCLDTSCVLGGRLTGLLLPDFQLISVPSRGNHWLRVRQEFHRHKAEAQGQSKGPQEPYDWDETGADALSTILSFVDRENQRLLKQLLDQPDYVNLTPRQQATNYDLLIGETPVKVLLHLARRGELTVERAKQILKRPENAINIARQLGLS